VKNLNGQAEVKASVALLFHLKMEGPKLLVFGQGEQWNEEKIKERKSPMCQKPRILWRLNLMNGLFFFLED
jgi:hypothetical protein